MVWRRGQLFYRRAKGQGLKPPLMSMCARPCCDVPYIAIFLISWSPLNSDSVQMEPNGPVRVRLVPFVHCLSYRLVWVKLDPPGNLRHDLEGICRIVLRSEWVNPFWTGNAFWGSCCDVPDSGLVVRVSALKLGGRGSIPSRVIPKTVKMGPNASLLNWHSASRVGLGVKSTIDSRARGTLRLTAPRDGSNAENQLHRIVT